ncbi:MAG: SDR family oxidoreductase [Candidatus Solibacter usitatus]|nr:SDR family oxidoreductase [Candidatus Solibacter usitatus]
MTLNLMGKRALVTGGTRGIGRAIAERLLEAGAGVAICGREEAGVAAAVGEMDRVFTSSRLKVLGRAADVRSESSVRSLFDWLDGALGGPDILVNNAGVGVFKDLASMEPQEWRTVMGTNLDGVYHCCHQALPRMRQAGGGWIINISSLAGKNAFAGGAAYNASKFGLCGMSEAVMLDHRYEGVRVSTVMPGSVSTDFGQGRADWKIAPEDVAEAVAAILAMPERTLMSCVELRPSRPPRR